MQYGLIWWANIGINWAGLPQGEPAHACMCELEVIKTPIDEFPSIKLLKRMVGEAQVAGTGLAVRKSLAVSEEE